MTIERYRSLIVFLLAMYIIASFADSLWPDLETVKIEEFVFTLDNGTLISFFDKYWNLLDGYLIHIILSILVYEIVTLVGLFLFKSWARLLLLLGLLIPLPFYWVIGPIVLSPISSILDETILIGQGALLAISYYSTISGNFEKEN